MKTVRDEAKQKEQDILASIELDWTLNTERVRVTVDTGANKTFVNPSLVDSEQIEKLQRPYYVQTVLGESVRITQKANSEFSIVQIRKSLRSFSKRSTPLSQPRFRL